MRNFKELISDITDNERPSHWKENAQSRRSQPGLRLYSSNIARRILAILEGRQNLSLADLADLLQISPQQISRILKGHENLTLEMIYKLSKALDTELLSFPLYKYSNGRSHHIPVQEYDFLRQTLTTSTNLTKTASVKLRSTAAIEIRSNPFVLS